MMKSRDLLHEVGNDRTVKRLAKLILLLLIGVLGVYVANFIFFFPSLSGDPADWGAFGDYFAGLINPIVAILTLFLVAATVYYTREMLQTTREEMRAAKTEMARQSFDGRAFFILKMFNDVRSSIRAEVLDTREIGRVRMRAVTGALALEHEYSKVIDSFVQLGHDGPSKKDIKKLIDAFESTLLGQSENRQYFSFFKSMVRALADAEVEKEAVQNYKLILGSVLSGAEAVLVFLYARSGLVAEADANLINDFLIEYVLENLGGEAATAIDTFFFAEGQQE